jgi:hypothetical protein
MNDVFWVGTFPGLDDNQIHYIARSIRDAGEAARSSVSAVAAS